MTHGFTPMTAQERDLWLASLYREATDRSYLRKPEKPKRAAAAAEPHVCPKPAPHVCPKPEPAKPAVVIRKASPEELKLHFDAGRYAAGHRDDIAVAAWQQLTNNKGGKHK